MTKDKDLIRVKRIKINIYNSEIHHIIGLNQTELLDYVDDVYGIEDDDEEFEGKCFEYVWDEDINKYIYPIVFVESSLDVALLSHELSHVIKNILRERNIKDDEAEAYLTGYLTQKSFKILKPFIQDL